MSALTNQTTESTGNDTIAGVHEPVISQYFALLNSGEFQAIGELFADDGVLQPPFEDVIAGQTAIVAYLDREARGFLLQPERGTIQPLDDGSTQYEVLGKVQTPWFSVNVAWIFILSLNQKILRVKVSLLASLQELLPLKSGGRDNLPSTPQSS